MKLCGFLLMLPLAYLTAPAQWSTTTDPADALQIGYGFDANGVVDESGSSILCPDVDNTILAIKLDQHGNRVWPAPVVAHYDDSSDFFGDAWVISDGSQGAIMLWHDHRGAYRDPFSGEYLNEAPYMQRVDSAGSVRWTPGGVLVAPAWTGQKETRVVTDGAGGVLVAWVERGFGYPGATGREYLKLARFDQQGQRRWIITLDSASQQVFLQFRKVVRAGSYAYLSYFRAIPNILNLLAVVDTSGRITPTTPETTLVDLEAWRDSTLFSLGGMPPRITKRGANGIVYWQTDVASRSGCSFPFQSGTMLPDTRGGVFLMYLCGDTLHHFDASGQRSHLYIPGINALRGYAFTAPDGGFVAANSWGFAQRFHAGGQPAWQAQPLQYLNYTSDVYFPTFLGDRNGGVIVTFWTTARGLCAQHTGRYGSPGVVPVRLGEWWGPTEIAIDQNYPNPFNSSTTLRIRLPNASTVRIAVYDIIGRLVEVLYEGWMDPGEHLVRWDAQGRATAIYYLQVEVGRQARRTMPLVLVK